MIKLLSSSLSMLCLCFKVFKSVEVLELTPAAVTCVDHPEKALETLQRQKFDLILLDVHLPGMSGFQFLEKLRSSDATSSIPVICICNIDSKRQLTKLSDIWNQQGFRVSVAGNCAGRRRLPLQTN